MPPDAPTSIEAMQLSQLITRANTLILQLGQLSSRLEAQLERGDRQLARIDEVLGQVAYLDGGIQQIGELDRKETAALERQATAIEQLAVEVNEMRRTSDGVLDLSFGDADLNRVSRLVQI